MFYFAENEEIDPSILSDEFYEPYTDYSEFLEESSSLSDQETDQTDELEVMESTSEYDEFPNIPYKEPVSYLYVISVLIFTGICLAAIHRAFTKIKEL